jgi:hypothetical protein
VGVLVGGFTSVVLLFPAKLFGTPGGGAAAAGGPPTEPITTANTMITMIKAAPKIKARRIQ